MYIKTVSDFVGNPLSILEWKTQLKNTFTNIEYYDITKYSLNPYFNYLFTIFSQNKHLPKCISDMLIYYFHSIPFQYIIAICKK